MKLKLIIMAIVLSLICPTTSNAFAILRYLFDGVANQLGLDRGPVPKTLPMVPPEPHGGSLAKRPDSSRIYIQAEGF